MADRIECIVVGGGPAGLSAALYLARFHRRVLVVHDGKSRALRIPRTHNVPGFPDGVEGTVLVARMAEHAVRYGAEILESRVTRARRDGADFVLDTADGATLRSGALVLATGVHLNELPLPRDVHERAIADGVLRYCPICDGHEHTGERIAVVGCDASGAGEALFLRQYSDDVTLVPMDMPDLDEAQRDALAEAGVHVERRRVADIRPNADCFEIHLEGDPEVLAFDVVYPALGTRQRTRLAVALGLGVDAAGAVAATSPLGTTVPGLYCAGDIVDGLDQISVAMGHGAVAATRAHNWLRERAGHALPRG